METPEQWPRVKEIVAEVLERDPQGRSAYLDEACAENMPLRMEVESLLVAFDESGSLFDVDAAESSTHPENVGPYRLIRELGFGGMGQVWLAEQTEPVRRLIALKLIRAGMFDAAVVHRFQAERQSLAIMDHPAIAKVFDAGTTPMGQPYFAMEYVAGLPITDYCDQKKVGIRERLTLFLQVCEGVRHAHQKAIIHRDLKPSNILVVEVDGKPRPPHHRLWIGKGDCSLRARADIVYGSRRIPGHTRLHEPRAGRPRRAGYRHTHRHIFAGRTALRTAHRVSSV